MALYTLNDDVLYEIFYAVVALEPPESMEEINPRTRYRALQPYFHAEKLGWIRLTHVCQRWRDILLGPSMAHLWGRIAFTYPSIAAFPTLLSRSRNALVDTFLHAPSDGWPVAPLSPQRVQTAMSILPRTRSLKLRANVENALLFLFAHPLHMPQLREIGIRLEYGRNLQLHNLLAFDGMGLVPPDIAATVAVPTSNDVCIEGLNVQTATVELSRLSLDSIAVPWLRFMLPDLRHLTTRIHDDARAQISDIRWLVSLLRTSPLLETLTIYLHLEGSTPDWDTLFAGFPVQLPNLKQITLEDCWSVDLAPFVAHVCETPPAFLHASCDISEAAATAGDLQQQTTTFIQGFSGYLCRPGHLALYLSPGPSGSSRAHRFVVQSMPALDDSDILDTLDLKQPGHQPQVENAALSLLPDTVRLSLAVSNIPSASHEWLEILALRIGNKELIEHLYLRVPIGIHGDWIETCRQHLLISMPAVRSLYVLEPLSTATTANSATASSWADTINILRPRAPGPPLFPTLHTLLVTFCAETFSPHAMTQHVEEWWDPLIQVLEQRHALGCPIHTLRIAGGWTKVYKASGQNHDEQMRFRAMGVIVNIVDERIVYESRWRAPKRRHVTVSIR
ncbi:hypothetical protein PENSPDRAFT_77685 [Peniophora sp. CONT]|nr:hypothetical protein PENSPDRAFT_77685 [Peniophora sp. CONT]